MSEWSIIVSNDELSEVWKQRLVQAANSKQIEMKRMPIGGIKLIGLTADGRALISELGSTLEP